MTLAYQAGFICLPASAVQHVQLTVHGFFREKQSEAPLGLPTLPNYVEVIETRPI